MKDYELLDIIGEVNEDYVLSAGENVVRPRFRWKTLAVCAACAALIAAAHPAARTFGGQQDAGSVPEQNEETADALVENAGLHSYTLVEGVEQIAMTASGEVKASAGGVYAAGRAKLDPAIPGGANMSGEDEAVAVGTPGQDASAWAGIPVQGEASAQCDRLLQSLGLWGIDGRGLYPDWCGGIWLDGEYLTVAIVDGFRTPELEAQIRDWCGGTGEVLFAHVKYSQNYLDGLMDEITRVFDELDCHISSAYGVHVMDNYLGLDFFGEVPGDEVLAALAELDPEGDAIRIQVFTDGLAEKTASGAAQEFPQAKEGGQPAAAGDDLPDYDLIVGADE